jgi:enediyne biosynthesis protein E3
MSTLIGRVRRRLFGISATETTVLRRGFHCDDPAMQGRIERIGSAFVNGYHAALEASRRETAFPIITALPRELRGFAVEGGAMGLALLDCLTPWDRGRIDDFLKGAGNAHTYMVHVGAGWAMARMPGQVERWQSRFDPLLRWLLVDGYGFHEGFFHWRKYLEKTGAVPRRLRGYAINVFYQGFGRSLWFIEGGKIGGIVRAIRCFESCYHPDLWSGVGLASVYAGELPETGLQTLRTAAEGYIPQLAQGAAFAAKARERAGNLTEYQDLACEVICGMDAHAAAALTDQMLENLPFDGAVPAYEIWRIRIQQRLSSELRVKL